MITQGKVVLTHSDTADFAKCMHDTVAVLQEEIAVNKRLTKKLQESDSAAQLLREELARTRRLQYEVNGAIAKNTEAQADADFKSFVESAAGLQQARDKATIERLIKELADEKVSSACAYKSYINGLKANLHEADKAILERLTKELADQKTDTELSKRAFEGESAMRRELTKELEKVRNECSPYPPGSLKATLDEYRHATRVLRAKADDLQGHCDRAGKQITYWTDKCNELEGENSRLKGKLNVANTQIQSWSDLSRRQENKFSTILEAYNKVASDYGFDAYVE